MQMAKRGQSATTDSTGSLFNEVMEDMGSADRDERARATELWKMRIAAEKKQNMLATDGLLSYHEAMSARQANRWICMRMQTVHEKCVPASRPARLSPSAPPRTRSLSPPPSLQT